MEDMMVKDKDVRDVVLPGWLVGELPEVLEECLVDFTDSGAGQVPALLRGGGSETSGNSFSEDDVAKGYAESRDAVLREFADRSVFCVRRESGEVLLNAATLDQAYNFCRDDLLETREEDERRSYRFSDRVMDVFSDRLGDNAISLPARSGNMRSLLILIPQSSRLDMLRYAFASFQKVAEAYVRDPDDFRLAYDFVDRHPAFWVKGLHASEYVYGGDTPKTLQWESAGHALKIWMVPDFSEDGSRVWLMETGSHVAPAYVEHYHDLRLDVVARTVEDGFVQLAALVHKFFDTDGSERPGVAYEKSELEILLERRLAEATLELSGDDLSSGSDL